MAIFYESYFNDFLKDCSIRIPGLDLYYMEFFKYAPMHKSFNIYGGFNWPLNGGRLIKQDFDVTEFYINKYTEMGFPISIVTSFYNNLELNEDTINKIKWLSNFKDISFIISNDKFNEFIKLNYPNIKRICSIVKSSIELGINKNKNFRLDKYNEYFSNYDSVVIHPDDNFSDILLDLPKDRIEILINECCRMDCPTRARHYLDIQKGKQNIYHTDVRNDTVAIDFNKFQELYRLGIRNFKLNGRMEGKLSNMLTSFTYYLIKSEYQMFLTSTYFLHNSDLKNNIFNNNLQY
jgi:hypothetical protein